MQKFIMAAWKEIDVVIKFDLTISVQQTINTRGPGAISLNWVTLAISLIKEANSN